MQKGVGKKDCFQLGEISGKLESLPIAKYSYSLCMQELEFFVAKNAGAIAKGSDSFFMWEVSLYFVI